MTGRSFILSIIEEYRNSPCLWQVTHIDYHNKFKRNIALNNLLKLFKAKDETSNINTVRKKIASMRNCFNKEVNKVKASMKTGVSADEIHVPKLWYYNEMLFLADGDTPRPTSSLHSVFLDDTAYENNAEISNESINTQQANNQSVEMVELQSPQLINAPSPSTSQSSVASRLKKKKTNRKISKIKKNLLTKIYEKIGAPTPRKLKYAAYGEHIAEKLRCMPVVMSTYCQKIINDAIFLAETDNLDITSHIVSKRVAAQQSVDQIQQEVPNDYSHSDTHQVESSVEQMTFKRES